MTEALDTLLTALYVEIDDHVVTPRQGRGRRPRLTDAELVCLAVAQVLLGFDNEHRWIRFAYCRLGHLFRYLPKQPGYHKRRGPRRRCSRRGTDRLLGGVGGGDGRGAGPRGGPAVGRWFVLAVAGCRGPLREPAARPDSPSHLLWGW